MVRVHSGLPYLEPYTKPWENLGPSASSGFKVIDMGGEDHLHHSVSQLTWLAEECVSFLAVETVRKIAS
jgi:hypothetical protein